jgi:hypothetical protein
MELFVEQEQLEKEMDEISNQISMTAITDNRLDELLAEYEAKKQILNLFMEIRK